MANGITNKELNSHIDQLVQHLAEIMGDYDTAYKNYRELRNSPKYSGLDADIVKSENELERMVKRKDALVQDLSELATDKENAPSEKVRKNLDEATAEKSNQLEQLELDIKLTRKDLREQKKTLQQLLDSDGKLKGFKDDMKRLEDEREQLLETLAQKRFYLTGNQPGAQTGMQTPGSQGSGNGNQNQTAAPGTQEPDERTFDRDKVLSDYVRLLRANEKWRNHTRIKLLRGRADKDLIGKDGNWTNEAHRIEKDFIDYAKHLLSSQTGTADEIKAKQLDEIKKLYKDIGDVMHSGKRLWADKLRSGAWLWARIGLGAALFGAGVLLGGWIGAIALGIAGAVGAVGRFLAVDGIMDKAHGMLSGRKDSARGIANKVHYKASGKRRDASVDRVFGGLVADAQGAADAIAGGFKASTDTLHKYRFWKRLTAIAAAVLPVAVVKYFGMGGDGTGANKAMLVENKPPVNPIPPVADQTYQITKGGSYWTMAEDIVKHNSPGSEKDVGAVTKVWKYLIQNKGNVGITDGEMHPHVGKTAPWLNFHDSGTPGKVTDMVLHQKEISDIQALLSGGNKPPIAVLSSTKPTMQNLAFGPKMTLKL